MRNIHNIPQKYEFMKVEFLFAQTFLEAYEADIDNNELLPRNWRTSWWEDDLQFLENVNNYFVGFGQDPSSNPKFGVNFDARAFLSQQEGNSSPKAITNLRTVYGETSGPFDFDTQTFPFVNCIRVIPEFSNSGSMNDLMQAFIPLTRKLIRRLRSLRINFKIYWHNNYLFGLYPFVKGINVPQTNIFQHPSQLNLEC